MGFFDFVGGLISAPFTAAAGLLNGVGGALGGGGGRGGHGQSEVHHYHTASAGAPPPPDPALLAEITKFREQNADLIKGMDKIREEMKKKNLDSFAALKENDKERANALVALAREAKPLPIPPGINIALFGLTSTGKSTMLNKLVNKKVAQTGAGETTMTITPYCGNGFTLWDIPGRNDNLSYFTLEYISFWKSLTHRLVLITTTVKEMTNVLTLLDAIDLNYVLVVNKFDLVEEDDRDVLKNQVQQQIIEARLKGVVETYYVSSKNPSEFPDWVRMIDSLTT